MLPRSVSKLSVKEEECSDSTKYMQRLVQDFELGESLGQGGFGQIFKARHKTDGTEVAIKIIKFKSKLQNLGKITREANSLARLGHKNIVRYYNSWIETYKVPTEEYKKMNIDSDTSMSSEIEILSENGYTVESIDFDGEVDVDNHEDEDDCKELIEFTYEENQFVELSFLFIHMELCDKQTLRNAIDDHLYLSEPKVSKYFTEICEGLSFIHQQNIVHRDLKPENIFLTSNDVIKIGDFGFSKQISAENNNCFNDFESFGIQHGSLSGPCGTHFYTAPEFYEGSSLTIKADIYSLGVTYFEMCSSPMTHMEKATIFPLNPNKIDATTLVAKKKDLLKTLLDENDNGRPTCDQILEILNSKKSLEQIKELIQLNKKVPRQQFKHFEKVLKSSYSIYKARLSNHVTSLAEEIFKRHGGSNIPMPTFLPSFKQFSSNLTTLLTAKGNSTSLANTSTLAFSYFAAQNQITSLRRYSFGRVFEEGHFSPRELQECSFQIVRPEKEDHLTDAEILYIGSQVCAKIYPNFQQRNVTIFINHSQIFSAILQHCKIQGKDATLLINLINNSNLCWTSKPNCFDDEVKRFLTQIKFRHSSQVADMETWILAKIASNYNNEVFAKIKISKLKAAFKHIKSVIDDAAKFGYSGNIFLHPLMVTQRHSDGITFKMLYKPVYFSFVSFVVAQGGRFEGLIQRCYNKKKRLNNKMSAIEINFNLNNILHTVRLDDPSPTYADVVILIASGDEQTAIPLYSYLLSHDIDCEIVKNQLLLKQKPFIVIKLINEDYGSMEEHCIAQGPFDPKRKMEVFTGRLRNENFLNILSKTIQSRKRFPLISNSMLFSK